MTRHTIDTIQDVPLMSNLCSQEIYTKYRAVIVLRDFFRQILKKQVYISRYLKTDETLLFPEDNSVSFEKYYAKEMDHIIAKTLAIQK